MWDGANSSTGPTRDSSRSRPHLRQEAAAASVDLKMEFYLSLLVSALLVGATEANAPTRPQRETATAAAGTGAPAAAFQQQAAAAPQTNHPRSRPAEAAAELKEEEEEEADPSDWKDEPCNFNLFYACAANQLWEFHKSFRNYMSLQLQQEPQRQALFLRDLQVPNQYRGHKGPPAVTTLVVISDEVKIWLLCTSFSTILTPALALG